MVICGVDGGGTKTKVLIVSDDNRKELVLGPSAIDTVNTSESTQLICNGIDLLMEELNLERIDSIFLGLGGILSDVDIEEINNRIRTCKYIFSDTIVNSGNDILNAYYSSCSGRHNITLIVGTGSVVFGIDEEGNSHRSGGIHYLEGDYGSGYDIGIRILKRMSLAFDNRIEHTEITKKLLDDFEINSIGDMARFFILHQKDRTFVASLAKMVTEYASKDDMNAIEVLHEGAKELVLGVQAVDNTIHLQNREIGIVGSLGNAPIYRDIIKSYINEFDDSIIIHGYEQDAVEGCIYLAKIHFKESQM